MAKYTFQQGAGGMVSVFDANEQAQGRTGYVATVPVAQAQSQYGYGGGTSYAPTRVEQQATPTPQSTPQASSGSFTANGKTYYYRPSDSGGVWVYDNPSMSGNAFVGSADNVAAAQTKLAPQAPQPTPQSGGGNPNSKTGNADLDAMGNAIIKATTPPPGQTINPNLQLDPQSVQALFDYAKTQLHPQFQQQLNAIAPDLNRAMAGMQIKYDTEQKNAALAFRNSIASSRENAAESGTTFSGLRGLNEQNAVDVQNRNFANLQAQTQLQAGNLAREAERQVGTANAGGFQPATIGGYNASLGGARGTVDTTGGGTGYYTPNASLYGMGQIPLTEQTQAQQLSQQEQTRELQRRQLNPTRTLADLTGQISGNTLNT